MKLTSIVMASRITDHDIIPNSSIELLDIVRDDFENNAHYLEILIRHTFEVNAKF